MKIFNKINTFRYNLMKGVIKLEYKKIIINNEEKIIPISVSKEEIEPNELNDELEDTLIIDVDEIKENYINE